MSSGFLDTTPARFCTRSIRSRHMRVCLKLWNRRVEDQLSGEPYDLTAAGVPHAQATKGKFNITEDEGIGHGTEQPSSESWGP
eukprot:6473613-Amphidinium_carterae.1